MRIRSEDGVTKRFPWKQSATMTVGRAEHIVTTAGIM